MKSLSIFLLAHFIVNIQLTAQFNLNFEEIEPGTKPKGWFLPAPDSYTIQLDSTISQSGKYSVSISCNEKTKEQPFSAFNKVIPATYAGKTITLVGYIKTENVEEGFAGLWLRIDGETGVKAFSNMQQENISGTSDWKLYAITLPFDEEAKSIVLGGLLTGKGKMWVDNLTLTLDGIPISSAPPRKLKPFKAQLDSGFANGSNFSIPGLTSTQKENLSILGKLWGFLKYYHPSIAKGEFNWDYELFRFLPKFINLSTKDDRNASILKWIEQLGEVPPCKTCTDKYLDSAKIKPDLGWLEDKRLFSDDVIKKLVYIRNNRHQGKQYYMELTENVLNPRIIHENEYSKFPYPDMGYRILALYRYWNLIQYWFPYKHLIKDDWKKLLDEFIPAFINAKDSLAYHLAALQLIARVHDTHANIWGGQVINDYRGKYYAPLKIKFIENKAVITGFLDPELGKSTGMERGDIITAVDGHSIDQILKDKLPFTPASNYPTQLRDIGRDLLRSKTNRITVEYKRNGKSQTRSLTAYQANELKNLGYAWEDTYLVDTVYTTIEKSIGYINLGKMKRDQVADAFASFKTTKGLIIDIRNYPNDFPIYQIAQQLNSDPKTFVRFTYPDLDYPGLIRWGIEYNTGTSTNEAYKGKVIILVNEMTQSSAEFHTMAFQTAADAVVLGSTTAGADGNVSRLSLPGGISSMFSGIGVYYPDGRETQRVGIVPDIKVKPTIEGVKAGRDELMEKAIEILNSAKKN